MALSEFSLCSDSSTFPVECYYIIPSLGLTSIDRQSCSVGNSCHTGTWQCWPFYHPPYTPGHGERNDLSQPGSLLLMA